MLQEVIAGLVVIACGLMLIRGAWRARRSASGGCGSSCGCSVERPARASTPVRLTQSARDGGRVVMIDGTADTGAGR